jgi:uncharacterized protein YajQ (UPF0234 family)
VRNGIESELAKIQVLLKGSKTVQGAIQEEKVRVTGGSDDRIRHGFDSAPRKR